jgi:ankyrin repeat protein
MEETRNHADYKEAKIAQTFFKELIQSCMDGDESKFTASMSDYISKNSNVSLEDVVTEFQSEGKTILHIASSSGHFGIVKKILIAFTDTKSIVNKQDDNGFTPLIYATISESTECMLELLKQGAEVNVKNTDGSAPVHFAAGDGSVDRLQLLLGMKLVFM